MKKKDLWILLAVLAAAGGLFAFSKLYKPALKPIQMGLPENATLTIGRLISAANAEETGGSGTAVRPNDAEQAGLIRSQLEAAGQIYADHYLLITVDGGSYIVPLIPEYIGQKVTLTLGENTNVVKILENGFMMESASCPDQICVSEGEVTPENISTRVLGNAVYCLPNHVSLEMYTAEEMLNILWASAEPDPEAVQ